MHEHKTKLFKNHNDKNIDGMIEVNYWLFIDYRWLGFTISKSKCIINCPRIKKKPGIWANKKWYFLHRSNRKGFIYLIIIFKFDFVSHLLDINN